MILFGKLKNTRKPGKSGQAIIDIQNNQNNVYNFIELTQATIDGHSFRAQEIWKLHNGQFYRDSLSISGFREKLS